MIRRAARSPTAARLRVRIIRACRELGIETRRGLLRRRRRRAARRAPPIAPCASARPPPPRATCRSPRSSRPRATPAPTPCIPGYGFLSENAAFARGLRATPGSIFVGPPADAIARMGSKIEARAADAARPACRSCPGETPADQTDAGIAAAVDARRLPGAGQGVGRRRRQGHARGRDARRGARRRSRRRGARRRPRSATARSTSSGSIERPRHVEVQVFADDHGHVVHLFERECSMQRRHQKVIEESPSPALTPALRARMTRRGGRGRARGRLPQRRHDRVPARGRRATRRASTSSR